jgi:hypothetical protein
MERVGVSRVYEEAMRLAPVEARLVTGKPAIFSIVTAP